MGYYMSSQFKCDLAFKVKLCSLQSLKCGETLSVKRAEKSPPVTLKSKSNAESSQFPSLKCIVQKCNIIFPFLQLPGIAIFENKTKCPLFSGNTPCPKQDPRCHVF